MNKLYLVITFLILINCFSFSQEKDSLFKLGRTELAKGNIDVSEQLFTKDYEQRLIDDDYQGCIKTLESLIVLYLIENDFDKVFEYLGIGRNLAKEHKLYQDLVKLDIIWARIHSEIGDLTAANKILDNIILIKDSSKKSLNNQLQYLIAKHKVNNNIDSTIVYLNKAQELAKGNKLLKNHTYMLGKMELDVSIHKNDTLQILQIENKLSKWLTTEKKRTYARQYLINLVRISHYFKDRANLSKRVNSLDSIVQFSPSFKDNLYYTLKSEYYALVGEYKKSLTYLNKANTYKDSINKVEKKEVALKLSALYRLKDKENQLLLANEESKNQKKIANYWMYFGGILILAFLLLIIVYSQKNKNHKLYIKSVEEKNELLETNIKVKKKHIVQLMKVGREKEHFHKKLQKRLKAVKSEKDIVEKDKKINGILSSVSVSKSYHEIWQSVSDYMDEISPNFIEKLKHDYDNLTDREIDICIFSFLNVPNKEIAAVLNVTGESLSKAKYRLKQKLDMSKDKSFKDWIKDI